MGISVGTPGSAEIGGNPGTLALDNDGDGTLLLGFVYGFRASGATPTPTSGGAVYNSVAMTVRQLADRGYTATAIWELQEPDTGVNTYDPDGTNCNYSAWGAVGLSGAKKTGAYKDGGNEIGLSQVATLGAAVDTVPGGIIVGIVGRGHSTALGIPAGWSGLWAQYDASGAGCRAAYKLTDGTPINPVFTLATGHEWALSVASYCPPAGGKSIMIFSKIQDFYDELTRGKIPADELVRRHREVFI